MVAAVQPLPITLGQSSSSSSSVVGPTGTAPGVTFVQQAEPPVDDSTNTGTFSWPMGVAMLFLLAVVVVILVRSRAGTRTPSSNADPRAGSEPGPGAP
jgi:hypothetical protein